ncbi:MAG: IS1595 family transposase [Acidobacteria bacterium]|nr:IS1595 family transposase [Acidobacteriota bacterium]
MDSPRTLQQAILYFADFDRCRDFLIDLRWPDGKVACPKCGSEHVVYLAKARAWKCYGKHSAPKFTLKTGTIFEDSPLGLDKWLAALWLLVNAKNGISSCEIARSIGITQKSAWFMAHRLRFALHHGSFDKLTGEVEVDETFIGGKARNMHVAQRKRRITGTGGKDKTAVMRILQRDGQVRTVVVENRKKKALQAEVHAHVEAGAALYTDALLSYDGLANKYAHQVIDHAVKYVDGQVHSNGLENYWSLLKRGIAGTYVSVEPFHLFRYLDEQAFRYNNRKDMGDFDRFEMAASQIVGKRLTWKQAIGMQDDARWAN